MQRGKLTAIKNSWLEHGLPPRQKVSFTPSNTTSLADVELVVRFILHYVEDNAILLPGRIPGYKRDDHQLLPSVVTKREVWELYHRVASSSDDSRALCYSLFCRLWRQLTPQVVVLNPMTDLCWTCQKTDLWRRRQRYIYVHVYKTHALKILIRITYRVQSSIFFFNGGKDSSKYNSL